MAHQGLIKFQKQILNDLDSKNYKKFAKQAREVIKSLYGYPVPKGAEIGIFVNDNCNLKCSHCYVASTHKDILEGKALSLDEWSKIIDNALNLGVTHFSIIGKEPLLSPTVTKRILERLDGKGVSYEIITNGILIPENIDWLKKFNFNFFSISFDGYQEDHDKIRGEGNYQKTRKGLLVAKKAGLKNLTVTHTVMPHNIKHLDKMIQDLAKCGAKYFSLAFCFPTDYNDNNLVAGNLELFDKVIEKLKKTPKNIDVSIHIVTESNASLIGALYRKGFFEQKLAVTEDLAPALVVPLSSNPRIAVQINILPTMFYGGFRLDNDGAVLDYCVDAQLPHRRQGFGNVRETSFLELWKKSREELWPQYTERYYQYLAKALNGDKLPKIDGWY